VRVESAVGKGTTFTVSIPKRSKRAATESAGFAEAPNAGFGPPLRIRDPALWIGADGGRRPMTNGSPARDQASAPDDDDTPACILVVDDNADMREYLIRILSQQWSVETAEDGQAALESALRRPPDLVLSDIMMPRMDGVALLNALREHPATRTVPIMLLSAQAGEAAIVHGIETGADDYLVKPFTARELVARVQMRLEMTRLRREWAGELERANKELEAFSCSVSHDLRAPLRAIDGFAKALLEDYGQSLDNQAGHYLGRVRDATRRMGELIDDLLELSRIARAPLSRQRVDQRFSAADPRRSGRARSGAERPDLHP
jgi:response regulator RpfG family c-di-GMP phosphodiesterase